MNVDAVLGDMHASLLPQWNRLVAAVQTHDLAPRIACVLELRSTLTPILQLTPSTLSWITELGAIFDIDILAFEGTFTADG